MKNKKGFTLVELLAVIVILGVLLLIAVPSIQNVIENSRKSAYESSVKMMIENVETLASLQTSTRKCYVDIADIDLDRGVKEGAGYIVYNPVTRRGTAYTYNNTRSYYVNGGTMESLVASKYKDLSSPTNGIGEYKFETALQGADEGYCSNDATKTTEATCGSSNWVSYQKITFTEDDAVDGTFSVEDLIKCPWYE